MEPLSIKDEFHRLIDEIQDEATLKELFESVALLARRPGDVLNDLSDKDLTRLDESVSQVRSGKIISDSSVRQKYSGWLTK